MGKAGVGSEQGLFPRTEWSTLSCLSAPSPPHSFPRLETMNSSPRGVTIMPGVLGSG